MCGASGDAALEKLVEHGLAATYAAAAPGLQILDVAASLGLP
jgi:hypothetical protein